MNSGKLNYKTKINIFFVFMAFLYLSCHFWMGYFDRTLPVAPFNGVLMAVQFAICLLMIRKDSKKGYIVSTVLMTISLIMMTSNIIIRHVLSPLPGVCNMIIYLFALFFLTKQFEYREKDAITDMLTGLTNRRGLFQQLDKKIIAQEPFHIIYVDLGNFKFINDNYGHICGDFVMMTLASRMKQEMQNKGTCSRIGGDEFVIVLNGDLEPGKVAESLLTKLGEKITVPMEGSTIDCYLTSYAGISSFPKDAENYEDLLKYADIAMYKALREHKGRISFFSKEMHQTLNRQVEVEKLIKEALESGFFYLVYQPQYSIHNKKLRGFEALLRMKRSDGVFVSPGEFIPIAENGELILSIDDFVLNRAMNDFKDIVNREGVDFVVSINISAKNIGNNGFVNKVKTIIEQNNFPAKNLEIEITEYCLVDSVDIAIQNIKELRAMGVKVALDDFGTGYSSLSNLAKMPINLLKIDKSLVDDIEKNSKRREFVNTVISLGHQMGCEVISEGVENETQVDILNADHCDFVQGFVWSKPLELDTAIDLAKEEAS
ncbi:MAG: bifunctional diguanylate cyclase/phosphodiesterase [Clostridia bacterium]|nr:bifunctional diguanylate cyclase/phosphodiesterase [Clostridia bacterium]